MENIDFRAKQQELLNTQQQLRNTKAELDDKTNQLENARLENENKKSELIEQLLSEIDALKENAKNYEQQIESINTELSTLRENFDSINQTTVDQTTVDQTTVDQSTSQQTVNQTTSQQTVDQTTSQQTVDQTTSQQTVNQTTSQQAVDQETTTEFSSTNTVDTTKQIDIHTYDGFLLALNELLQEIEDTESGITKKGLSKAGKKTMNEAKTKLKQYRKQLNAKKNALLKQNGAEIYENDISNLKNLWQQTNKVREDIGMGQRGEFSSTASYLYNSPENARKANKHQIDNAEFNRKFQNELKEGAILQIFGGSTQKANDFYRRIAEGRYTEADYTLFTSHSDVLTPSFQRCGILIPISPTQIQGNGGRLVLGNGGTERVSSTVRRSADYSNMDFGEAFQQGGLAGVVDKALSNCKNLTPGQRNTWKSIAVLGGYAAGIYGLYKFFTNKKMGFWGKAGITAAAILGSQVATGEGPIALFNKLMTGGFTKEYLEDKFGNAFGDAVDGVQNSGIESGTNLSGAMYSLMIFNETATVGEVRGRSTKFKNDPQSWTQFRGAAKEKIGEKHFERFSAVFSENFDENKWNEWLNSIGIHDGVDNNKLIYELASYKTMNTIIINKFLSDNGVKVTSDKTQKAEYEQYIQSCNNNNKTIDIKTLKTHMENGSWFKEDLEATFTDREIDIENIKQLENQVEALSIDPQKKSELKVAVKRFYDERSIKNKPNINDFNLQMEGDFLVLTSHGEYKSKIDINKNEIVGFGNGIRFTRLTDLLNTADLANKILQSQKGKTPKDMPPFEYKIVGKKGRGIYFNDTDYSDFLSLDTMVLSGGRGGTIGKIDTLCDHPEEYADYLSNGWIEQNKINIDGSFSPTMRALSDAGITFTNEQEVKNLETWLKGIKEKLKFSVCNTNGNPFSIGILSKKLEFKAVNGDTQSFPENISEKFPTLLRTGNKEKFLKMMNDPNNKMRGSR